MPTNLPPDYFNVEEKFRTARSVEEKIGYLEEMMAIVPKHKGTDRLRADLRRRLSQLKSESQTQKGGVSRQVSPYRIPREGAGQVVLVGLANVGKSALVDAFTNAEPEVAAHPFTTWSPTPGMMPIENIQVQLIDTPPLNPDFIKSDMMDLIRRADLLLIVVDLQTFPIEQLEETVAILEDQRIVPACLRDRYSDRFDLTFVPTLVVANKTDDESLEEDFEVLKELLDEAWSLVPVSATTGHKVDQFKWKIYERLDIIRIYAKPPGKEPDMGSPFVMRRGGTVEDFAAKVHQDFVKNLKSARIWGEGVYDGQAVGRDHVLHDGDIVELRT
ncbi:MAG: TGS domain-containing protein [Anaerolineae bacterium]